MEMHPDPKPVTVKDDKYREWIRTQPCVLCGRYANPYMDVAPAHASGGGMGKKSDDTTCLPLCVEHHRWEHDGYTTGTEKTFEAMVKFKTGKTRGELVVEHQERYRRSNDA